MFDQKSDKEQFHQKIVVFIGQNMDSNSFAFVYRQKRENESLGILQDIFTLSRPTDAIGREAVPSKAVAVAGGQRK